MQTLVFNTTTKIVTLYSGSRRNGVIIERFENVPTVKIMEGYYEVMQKPNETLTSIPVLRVPISNTNMLIEK